MPKDASNSTVMEARHMMVLYARQNIGSKRWSDTSIINAKGTAANHSTSYTFNPAKLDKRALLIGFKCNLFVADMAKEAGAATWIKPLSESLINTTEKQREPTTKEWSNKTYILRGWRIVEDIQPGDVACDGHHMGIVSGAETLISASSRIGEINEVKWEPMKTAIKRRFIGLTIEDISAGAKPIGKTIRCF